MISQQHILIIGGSGSIGNNLIRKYHTDNTIYVLSRDELKQSQIKLLYPNVKFRIGDIRNKEEIHRAIQEINPDIIILCAALKHIDICEDNISECLATNISGIQNVIDSTLDLSYTPMFRLKSVVFISTDKACSPINTYGMAKAISERLVVDASRRNNKIKYICVRYGNVLNSRGSIIPKFTQIGLDNIKDFFPVTDKNMTRFFMTLEHSVHLIHTACIYGISGETWIPIVPSFKIVDLANYYSSIYNKPIKIIGLRTGEKYHECLINDTELTRTIVKNIQGEDYYVIKPCFENYNIEEPVNNNMEYTSEKVGTYDEMVSLISNHL